MTSLRFGKILGISLELHSTFLLMMVLIIIFLSVFDPQNLLPTLMILVFLFVSVFIHELFHSIVAVTKGIKVSKITLLPIGGLSMTSEMPQKALDEFLIAIAGPAFNFIVVIAIIFIAGIFPSSWPGHIISNPDISPEELNNALFAYPLFGLFWVNLMLGAFNLFVPALPLDGGRVLRAILSTRLGFSKATKIATGISKIIAAILFLVGFFIGNLFLPIIAVFVFLGASQENEIVFIREVFNGLTAKDALNRRPQKLKPDATVGKAFAKMTEKKQPVFLLDSTNPLFVSVEMLERVKKDERNFVKAHEIAQPVPAVNAALQLEKTLAAMLSKNTPVLAVKEKEKIIGFIFEQDIQQLLRIKKAEKQLA